METHSVRVLACISTLGVLLGQCGAYTLLHTLCLQQEAVRLILVGALALLMWVSSMLWLAHREVEHSHVGVRMH
jgi:hypothetical protein